MAGPEKQYLVDSSFRPWGPFISPNYKQEPITKSDVTIASIVWGLTIFNACIALCIAFNQTKGSRAPWRSVYIWMIWVELGVSFAMGLECYFHLLKMIRPSFAFYFTILFFWCIQVQLLLQIVINRIRVIIPDRRRSRTIMISTAVFVTVINITVFNIWIPARLQINQKYCDINVYWDRIEKTLYLIVDLGLNWFFLRTVRLNLIANGLTKYDRLVCFNRKIVVLSILMDIMIIAAMSIPNSFVYMQFHPLAYLVKLNIEMTMANLIKQIAISTSCKTGRTSIADEFKNPSDAAAHSRLKITERLRNICGPENLFGKEFTYCLHDARAQNITTNSAVSFPPTGKQIKTTREVIVSNEPNPFFRAMRHPSEFKIMSMYRDSKASDSDFRGLTTEKTKSTDGTIKERSSMESAENPGRGDDNDDEAVLVWQKFNAWMRRDG